MPALPCRDEDLLKLGFSRDPFTRFSTLHRRFFTFFDLDRGLLVDAERVAVARRIERTLIETFRDARAMAPLVVPAAAGGHTELVLLLGRDGVVKKMRKRPPYPTDPAP